MQMGTRLKQWLLDPVLILGSVISVVSPVLLYQKGAEADFSVLFGLLLFIVTLQVQVILTDKDRLSKETLYGRTVAAFESTSWLADEARRILASMEGAERRFRNSPVDVTCRSVFERLAADLAQLSEGRIRLPPRDKDFVVAISQEVRRHIRALTVEGPRPAFWLSPTGRQYFEAQRDAITRGILIERVIVYDEWSPSLDAIAREQQAAGIKVYRVASNRLPPDLRVNLAVWDDLCGFETEVNAGGEAISHRFTILDYEVRELRRRFHSVWTMREDLLKDETASSGTPAQVAPVTPQ